MRAIWLVGVAALVVAGCSAPPSPCEGFNPFADYGRAQPETGKLLTIRGGTLTLGLSGTPAELDPLQKVLERALSSYEGGGGSLTAPDKVQLRVLGDFVRAGSKAETARVTRVDLEFGARIRNSLAPMRVVWRGSGKKVDLDLAKSSSGVRLVEEGQGSFRLLFRPKVPLEVASDQVYPVGAGLHAFKQLPFKLYERRGKSWSRVRIRPRRLQAKLAPLRRVRFLEVSGFTGDLQRYLCEVLHKEHPEGERLASFGLKGVQVWLSGSFRKAPPPPPAED